MKKSILLSVFLLICITASSQALDILIPYRNGNLWGFADTSGSVKIEPEFTKMPNFRDSIAIVQIGDKQGAINRVGKKLVEVNAKRCFHFFADYFLVYSDNYAGVVNINRDTVVPFVYSVIEMNPILSRQDMFQKRPSTINNDFFYIFQKDPSTKISKKGILKIDNNKWSEFIPCKYEEIYFNKQDQLFKAYRTSKDSIDFINLNAEIKQTISLKHYEEEIEELDLTSYEAMDYENIGEEPKNKYPNFEYVESKKGKGIIVTDQIYSKGKKVLVYDSIPALYDSIDTQYSKSSLYPVLVKGKWGLVGTSGSLILLPEFDDLRVETVYLKYKKLERLLVKKNGKWGIIQIDAPPIKKKNNYTFLLNPIYDDLKIFRNYPDVILVNQNGLWGVESVGKYPIHIVPKYLKILDTFHIVERFPLFQVIAKDKSTVYLGVNGVEFFTNIEL